MRHTITITAITQGAGVPTTRDGVMGMVIQGVSIPGTLAYDTPFLLTKLTDAATFGINAAYDATNSTAVYQQISEFYGQAGDGAFLWVQVCAMATAYATYVPSAPFKNFITFSAQADKTMQVKIVGVCYAPPTNTQNATDFPADVTAAITALQTLQKQQFQTGYPWSAIVDGYNMSSTITPSTLGTQATNTAYAVSLCITGTMGNGVSAVGLALGKFARITVGRGMGAVEDGAISTSTAWLTNGILLTSADNLTTGLTYIVQGADGSTVTYNGVTYGVGHTFVAVAGHATFTTTGASYVIYNSTPISNVGGTVQGISQDDINTLGDKQYMFITTVEGISGLFWNDGATCVADDNFFSSQEYNRVMNSLAYDARAFFTLLRGLNLPSDDNGDLDSVFCSTKAKTFKTKFINPLTANSGSGDISDGNITVAGPGYAATGDLQFAIDLIRATIVGNITGTMQFVLSL